MFIAKTERKHACLFWVLKELQRLANAYAKNCTAERAVKSKYVLCINISELLHHLAPCTTGLKYQQIRFCKGVSI